MVTAGQIRAARGLIHWSQKDLGRHTNLSQAAIANIENANVQPSERSIDLIRDALERAGLEFIDGGVRLRPDAIDTVGGDDFSIRIMDVIFDSLLHSSQKEYLISGVSFHRAAPVLKEAIRHQVSRLKSAGKHARILVPATTKADDIIGPLEWHRKMPVGMKRAATPCFVFNDSYGTSMIEHKKVLVMRNLAVAEDQRDKFNFLWQNAGAIRH